MSGQSRGKEEKGEERERRHGKCLSMGMGPREKSHRKCRRQTKIQILFAKHKSAAPIDKLEKSKATSPTSHRKYRASCSMASWLWKTPTQTPFCNLLSPMQIPHFAKPTCLISPSDPLRSATLPFHCVVHHSSTPSSSSPQQASSNAPFPTPS